MLTFNMDCIYIPLLSFVDLCLIQSALHCMPTFSYTKAGASIQSATCSSKTDTLTHWWNSHPEHLALRHLDIQPGGVKDRTTNLLISRLYLLSYMQPSVPCVNRDTDSQLIRVSFITFRMSAWFQVCKMCTCFYKESLCVGNGVCVVFVYTLFILVRKKHSF